MIRLALPYPPSGNRYWRHCVIGGRPRVHVTHEARKYRDEVAKAVQAQVRDLLLSAKLPMPGRLAVRVVAHPPDRRRRDIADNLFKVLGDALEKAGVYENDSQIDDYHVTRGCVAKPGAVVVEITKAQEEAA